MNGGTSLHEKVGIELVAPFSSCVPISLPYLCREIIMQVEECGHSDNSCLMSLPDGQLKRVSSGDTT